MKSKPKSVSRAGDLKPAPYNPRTITDEKLDLLGKAMREFGDLGSIVFNVKTGNLVGGHQRLKHLDPAWKIIKRPAKDKTGTVALGTIETHWGSLGYREVAWPEAKEKQANLAANQHSGDWDTTALADLLKDMDDGARLLAGFTAGDMQELKLDVDLETEADAEPQVDRAAELQKEWRTARGQLWALDSHRLLCGDSTKREDVARVMGGEKSQMIFTDPPYGVGYDGGATSPRKLLAGDESEGIYAPCCKASFDFSDQEAAFYFWHAYTKAAAAAAAAAGYIIRSLLIWNKNQAQFGALSAQYKQKHEPCLYCVKRGHAARWYGPTNEVTVWDCDRESVNEFHPTQKPPELAARAMRNSSRPGDIVSDWFLGSGATLIACENLGRKCRAIEIDPGYVAVALERFKTAFGKTPKLLK